MTGWRMTHILFVMALVVFVMVALTAPPASAQEEETKGKEKTEEAKEHVEEAEGKDRSADFEESLQEARERLQLTDEQVEPLLQIVWDSFEAGRAVLEAHGIDLESLAEGGSNRQLNLRQLRKFQRDMDVVHEAMFTKIEEQGFLSDEQFAEFKKLQEEQREALRERLRARRDGR